MFGLDNSLLEINVAKTSNNNYLKNHTIKSGLIDNNSTLNYSTLNSFIDFSVNRNDLSFSASVESFEDRLSRYPRILSISLDDLEKAVPLKARCISFSAFLRSLSAILI